MGRRRKGEGSISRTKSGKWVARVDLGFGPTGKRLRRTAYADTATGATAALRKLLGRKERGELLASSSPALSAWLEHWFTTHKDEWRPGTIRVYRHAIDRWLVPSLGSVKLDNLTPTKVQAWVNAAKPGRMLATARVVLRSALGFAMTQRMLTFNAATLVKMPAVAVLKPRVPLTADQVTALLAVEHRLAPLVATSVLLGLRVGEVCGLTWKDVNLVTKELRVRQQVDGSDALVDLKTATSRRTLTMPARLVTILQAHKKVRHIKDLVFVDEAGRMLRPWQARKALAQMLKTAELPSVPFHALRHTTATLLLTAGVPLFDVSRILGHNSIDITADLYGHLAPDMTAGAAATMDAILRR